MSFSLSGMNIVVTGCATGIGQGIALGLCKAGATILALDIADLSKTCRLVEEAGGRMPPLPGGPGRQRADRRGV